MPGGETCERSVSRAENGAESRKSGGVERSGERVWQKTMERERSVEREIAVRGAGTEQEVG